MLNPFPPNDVNIRCRVRRSLVASKPEFEDAQDMICTMRGQDGSSSFSGNDSINKNTWLEGSMSTSVRSNNRPSSSSSSSAALFLVSVKKNASSKGSFSVLPSLDVANGDNGSGIDSSNSSILSFGRERSVNNSRNSSSSSSLNNKRSTSSGQRRGVPLAPLARSIASAAFAVPCPSPGSVNTDSDDDRAPDTSTYIIPLSDILVVDVNGSSTRQISRPIVGHSHNDLRQMFITTYSNGYFQFQFYSKNSHDVLLALLEDALPPENFTGLDRSSNNSDSSIILKQPSTHSFVSVKSMDMDRFETREFENRGDTVGEKIQRKFADMVSQIVEYPSAISDCLCAKKDTVMWAPPEMTTETTLIPENPSYVTAEHHHVFSFERSNNSSTMSPDVASSHSPILSPNQSPLRKGKRNNIDNMSTNDKSEAPTESCDSDDVEPYPVKLTVVKIK